MDLAFDCNPPNGSTDDDLDIMRTAYDRITNFLAGDGSDPPIGKAEKRFSSESKTLHVTIKIPTPPSGEEDVPDGPTISEVGGLYTKLLNNLDLFPPLVDGDLPKFKFVAMAYPEPIAE